MYFLLNSGVVIGDTFAALSTTLFSLVTRPEHRTKGNMVNEFYPDWLSPVCQPASRAGARDIGLYGEDGDY